ncbi:ribokinase [Luteibacter sp. UNCMF366Tsu5.1]|uniref:ribokinase n=1 Tax=Luteibacter sp. UNCMF366Tsu5.1 TaxID=1502758 RepID=UPI000908C469|nr:ribokinase [Luteibacter sp. UNCMF366Tsu5.1]SFW69068.1 ribokinase [Luteibacter sp. UNCMF366Tsu5.1]
MTRIVVVGSINMDLVTLAPRFPEPGETLTGDRFLTVPGGKGANQAVAAARLGARVSMVGAVGDDAFGRQLYDGLVAEGVDVTHVARLEGIGSGTASITVAGGENNIVVVPAANGRVTPAQVEAARAVIRGADALLVQLEIPLDAVEATLRVAREEGVPVILNPAPAQRLPVEWLAHVRFLTPNQHELTTVLGAESTSDFRELMRRAPCPVVLTRGEDGAWFRDGDDEPRHQSGFKVEAVDSTGAGDTFNAALAVYLHDGLDVAVRKACAAAAIAVSRLGAQAGMPRADEVNAFLEAHS